MIPVYAYPNSCVGSKTVVWVAKQVYGGGSNEISWDHEKSLGLRSLTWYYLVGTTTYRWYYLIPLGTG